MKTVQGFTCFSEIIALLFASKGNFKNYEILQKENFKKVIKIRCEIFRKSYKMETN